MRLRGFWGGILSGLGYWIWYFGLGRADWVFISGTRSGYVHLGSSLASLPATVPDINTRPALICRVGDMNCWFFGWV